MLRKVNGVFQEVRPDALTAEIFQMTMDLKKAEEESFLDWSEATTAALKLISRASRLGLWRNNGQGFIEAVRVYSMECYICTRVFTMTEPMIETLTLPAYREERAAAGPFRLEFHLLSQS